MCYLLAGWLCGFVHVSSEMTMDLSLPALNATIVESTIRAPFTVTSYPVAMAASGSQYYIVNASASILTSSEPAEAWHMTMSPSNFDNFYSVATANDGSFVAVGGINGLYVSTDGGAQWTTSTFSGVPYPGMVNDLAVSADTYTVFCITPFYGYLSTNGGMTFTPVVSFTLASSPLSVAMTSSGLHIAVGTSTGVRVSNDAGRTWSIAQGLPFGSLYYEAIVRSPSRVIVGSRDMSIYTSSDGGLTFTTSSTAPDDGVNFLCASEDLQYVIAATMDALYASRDAGDTWQAIGQLPSMYRGSTVEAMVCNTNATTVTLVTVIGRVLMMDIAWATDSAQTSEDLIVE